jgi:O-6-methylguanine DNA methyltransferase
MPKRLVVENRLLLPDLSRKQAAALLAAHDAGYYRLPRAATTAELAGAAGLSPSAFKERLQRAEAQVVEAMLPFLRLRAGAGAEAGVERVAAFARGLGVWVVLEVRGGRIKALRLEAKAPRAAGRRHPFLTRVLQHLRDGRALDDLPLELEGHGFAAEVLQALRDVPAGTTVTYAELARRLGKPGAARAVGNACAANPFLLVVPCHRVVPAAGGVGNYAGAGGAATKRKLLAREAAGTGKA